MFSCRGQVGDTLSLGSGAVISISRDVLGGLSTLTQGGTASEGPGRQFCNARKNIELLVVTASLRGGKCRTEHCNRPSFDIAPAQVVALARAGKSKFTRVVINSDPQRSAKHHHGPDTGLSCKKIGRTSTSGHSALTTGPARTSEVRELPSNHEDATSQIDLVRAPAWKHGAQGLHR